MSEQNKSYGSASSFDREPMWKMNRPVDEPLTKRERFAMAAMQGILSNPNVDVGDSRWPTWLEYTAKRIADAQLKELEES